VHCYNIIKEQFIDIINSSLREDCCPEGWKTFTIIPIPKIEKTKKASEYRSVSAPSFIAQESRGATSCPKAIGVTSLFLGR